ncbi:MAG: hypothetical protein Q3983_01370 [Capnocytophaga sp.]|nr:hypothetical protein [Capnocytophaga sp.]
MGLFDLFKKKKAEETILKSVSYKRYWLDAVSTISLPEDWEIFNTERFFAKSPNGNADLTVINYDEHLKTDISKSFFEDLKLDFYQEYEQEGFTAVDEAEITDTYICKTFRSENEVQYHFTTALKSNNNTIVTELLLRDTEPYTQRMRDFVNRVGQSIQHISDFTTSFIEKLKSKNEEIEIISSKGFELEWVVKTRPNEIITSFLDNSYAEYMHRNEESRDEILDRYANYLMENIQPSPKSDAPQVTPIIEEPKPIEPPIIQPIENESNIDKSLIFPLVRNIQFIDSLRKEFTDLLYEPINPELFIIYVIKGASKCLENKDLASLQLNKNSLKNLAIENLVSQVEVNLEGENSRFIISAGGRFEASFLIIPDVWTKENFPVKGNIVVGIPTENELLITGSEYVQEVEKLREYVKETYQNTDDPLSENLFEIKDNRISIMKF